MSPSPLLLSSTHQGLSIREIGFGLMSNVEYGDQNTQKPKVPFVDFHLRHSAFILGSVAMRRASQSCGGALPSVVDVARVAERRFASSVT